MPDFTAPTPEMIVVLPELLLVAAVFLILLVDPFTGRDRTAVVAIALSGLLASGVAAVALSGQEIVSFGGMVALDGYAVFFKVLFAAAGVLTVLMSPKYLEAHGRHIGEYYALLVLAIVGMDLMSAARDLIAFYVALELMAISSYLLAGFFRNHVRSSEAALKYFITGALASALTLYGISLVYGMTGATNYYQVGQVLLGDPSSVVLALATALIVIGMGFKVSVAPFHMWTPDVYQGAPTPIAGFFSVGPKAAGFSAIVMVLMTVLEASQETWSVLLIFLSLLTMATGTLMALVQKNVKRMLAYSSIAHVGYLLAGSSHGGKAGQQITHVSDGGISQHALDILLHQGHQCTGGHGKQRKKNEKDAPCLLRGLQHRHQYHDYRRKTGGFGANGEETSNRCGRTLVYVWRPHVEGGN